MTKLKVYTESYIRGQTCLLTFELRADILRAWLGNRE